MFMSALTQLFQISHFPYLMAGVFLGLTLGILPGLGGTSGLAILLPFVYTFEPSVALAMMIGVLAPTTTSDTFPAVLLGIPEQRAHKRLLWMGTLWPRKVKRRGRYPLLFFRLLLVGCLERLSLASRSSLQNR